MLEEEAETRNAGERSLGILRRLETSLMALDGDSHSSHGTGKGTLDGGPSD
jgi:hypothetical protein